jgi:glycosyltransferase involved in cell wall biosynthesis
MGLVVLQQGPYYEDVAEYLVNDLGASKIQLPGPKFSIAPKISLILSSASDGLALLRNSSKINLGDDIVVFSHFSTFVKILARLKLINYRKLYCYGFFIHSPKWFPLFRLLRCIDTERDHYIVFTRKEVSLYAGKLRMDATRIHYLPHGNWRSNPPQVDLETAAKLRDADYYFAGGYSNRDYGTLISTFSHLPQSLVIICSERNKDVSEGSLPKNITVLRDVPGEKFDAYVRQAKACIVPLKHDSGASGISTLLRYMRNGKLCIVTNRSGARDYVEDRVSGYLVHDMSRELPELIAQIEADPQLAVALGKAGRERYFARHTRAALSLSLKQVLLGEAVE